MPVPLKKGCLKLQNMLSAMMTRKCNLLRCEYVPGSLDGSEGKESAHGAGDTGDASSVPGSERYPGEGNGNPLQYSYLKKSHGQRNLVGYSPKGRKESDTIG